MKLFLVAVLSLGFIGCGELTNDKKSKRGMDLSEARDAAFDAGLNILYSTSYGTDGECYEMQSIDYSAVRQTPEGIEYATAALKDFRSVFLNSVSCVYNFQSAENLFYNTLANLEDCRSKLKTKSYCW
jgi:hypothetical protein